MSAPDHYQAIVIGSGQGETPLSVALANAGLRTALIADISIRSRSRFRFNSLSVPERRSSLLLPAISAVPLWLDTSF
jgi:hypothetical protein